MEKEFQLMNKDTVIANVTVNGQKIFVEDLSANFLDAGQSRRLADASTPAELNDWFEERCFLRSRADAELLLKGLGLTSYAPYNIVRKTHGVLCEDTYWVRFSDCSHLTWAEVNPRK